MALDPNLPAFVRERPGRDRNAPCKCGHGPAHKTKRCPERARSIAEASAHNERRHHELERALDAGGIPRNGSFPLVSLDKLEQRAKSS